jgi:hypothetical protein
MNTNEQIKAFELMLNQIYGENPTVNTHNGIWSIQNHQRQGIGMSPDEAEMYWRRAIEQTQETVPFHETCQMLEILEKPIQLIIEPKAKMCIFTLKCGEDKITRYSIPDVHSIIRHLNDHPDEYFADLAQNERRLRAPLANTQS